MCSHIQNKVEKDSEDKIDETTSSRKQDGLKAKIGRCTEFKKNIGMEQTRILRKKEKE